MNDQDKVFLLDDWQLFISVCFFEIKSVAKQIGLVGKT